MQKTLHINCNITADEKLALDNLKTRDDIIIHSADKGGKIVIMNRTEYIKACQDQLEDTAFYRKLEADETTNITANIKEEINNMRYLKYITDKEYKFLTSNLQTPRTSVFYGLPKIHKVFDKIPPMRPIVSGYQSCTANLSEYLDSFLKYQARKCKSYIQDTNNFLVKLKDVGKIPLNSILCTMDVASLYTNIDQNEGAEACFDKLETRQNKQTPSSLLKKLILIVLKANIFKFNNNFYKQIKGTAMGTPMAPSYANIFMDKIEQGILNDFYKKCGLKPLIWLRYIDDIFFIWTHGPESFQLFIEFAQTYSTRKNMNSKLKYEVHHSNDQVNFLDVTVKVDNGFLSTTVYSKPTDSHVYLNVNSCHPEHVIKNIPKGQFTRLRRICSDTVDFMQHSNIYTQYFINQGYNKQHLNQLAKEISKLSRDDLLQNKTKKQKDQTTIFVTTWHPKLKKLSSVLLKHFHLLQNDPKLKSIFPEKPIVAFRRKKNLKNHLARTDITPKQIDKTATTPCNKCKLCNLISTDTVLVNHFNNRKVHLPSGCKCRSKNVIYAAKCKIHGSIYIGHTGEELRSRFSKHRYDANKRPDKNELANHISTYNHNFDTDIDVTILKNDLSKTDEREFFVNKFICLLGTKQPNGLDIDSNAYGQ